MGDYQGSFPVKTVDTTDKAKAIEYAMEYISLYGQIGGDHHKAWVLDQVARILQGTPIEVSKRVWTNQNGSTHTELDWNTGTPSKKYLEWVNGMRFCNGEEYDYDEGIAP